MKKLEKYLECERECTKIQAGMRPHQKENTKGVTHKIPKKRFCGV